MSAYRLGLTEGGTLLPEQATYAIDRLGRITSGSRDVFRGGSRFYGRGIVGANSPGFVGSVVDGIMGFVLDIIHVILLVGGGLLLWRSLAV